MTRAGTRSPWTTPLENGCRWVLPGSHRRGVLYPDRDHDDPRFGCEVEAYDCDRDEDAVTVEVAAGSAVLFNGSCCTGRCPTPAATGCAAPTTATWCRSPAPTRTPKGVVDVIRPHVRPDRQGGCLR